MGEDIALPQCHHPGGGAGTVQLQLQRLKGGARLLLSDGDDSAGGAHTGCRDGVIAARRHFRGGAKTPDGTVERTFLEKKDSVRGGLEEPVQLRIVPGFALQDSWVCIHLWGSGHRGRGERCPHLLGVIV